MNWVSVATGVAGLQSLSTSPGWVIGSLVFPRFDRASTWLLLRMKRLPARLISDPNVPEQQVIVFPLAVLSRLLPPDVPSTMGKACAPWLVTPAGCAMVTFAVADCVVSACATAVTFTLGGLGSFAGAVYKPD